MSSLARVFWLVFVLGSGLMIWFGRKQVPPYWIAGGVFGFGFLLLIAHGYFKPPSPTDLPMPPYQPQKKDSSDWLEREMSESSTSRSDTGPD